MAIPKLKRTLYIGLGGTGFKTLLHTKRAFIETYGEVPPMIKFLAIDADQNQYKSYSLPSIYGDIAFDPGETSDVMVRNAGMMVSRNRQQLTWLPDQNMAAASDLVNGCGMVRTNGRLAFCFNYPKTRSNIQNALNQICNIAINKNQKYDLLTSGVDINIVYSIAGGTGSGTFIDIAYLVKDIVRSLALDHASVIGYMVLPDVYDTQLVFGKDRLFPNAWGSLADLDYFMGQQYDWSYPINYLTTNVSLVGNPFSSLIAISNSNQNGDTVDHSDKISEMLSMAMVTSAGELSGGLGSVGDNFKKDVLSGNFDIANKKAIMGTLGMSSITFRASELSALYQAKAAREVAAMLLNPGSNTDIAATTWIDNAQIRENNGKDDVIDYVLVKNPQSLIQEIIDYVKPENDVNGYRNQVSVSPGAVNMKVDALKQRTQKSLDDKVRELVNIFGPAYADDFVSQVNKQIDECLKEMQDELKSYQSKVSSNESAIKTYCDELKTANSKFLGRKKAVQEASSNLCDVVNTTVVNEREIQRRQAAITFYTWLQAQLDQTHVVMKAITDTIKSACEQIGVRIAKLTNDLQSSNRLFEIDLTKPYLEDVSVMPSDISLNQFVLSLKGDGTSVFNFANEKPAKVVGYMMAYAQTLTPQQSWGVMSVEDALKKLPRNKVDDIISQAIALSSPMCRLNYQGYLEPQMNNYYYVGVCEMSGSLFNSKTPDFVDIEKCIPGGEMSDVYLASTGSRDRIVFYHQYGVFPTYAIAGANTYSRRHEEYVSRPTAFSCNLDEDIRKGMQRNRFSIFPQEQNDDSLELWVKGIIFGLITRDANGVYMYKDESNTSRAIFGYITSLGSTYRDEAFRNFKREAGRIRPMFDKHISERRRAEGEDVFNNLIADVKSNYLNKYSLNTLTQSDFNNSLYKGIVDQLNREIDYVTNEL